MNLVQFIDFLVKNCLVINCNILSTTYETGWNTIAYTILIQDKIEPDEDVPFVTNEQCENPFKTFKIIIRWSK